ncbi:MAG: FAD-dependent oxidoreductase [Candidatus Eiseniibacteriota bacterium]|nr:MAG: FAD-dependent oxidoreductase [Candidatus Eisenbacteria bacterium]
MKKSKFITEFGDIPAPREKMPHLPLEERGQSFEEVEQGFEEERALKEARRCLSCRRCIGCGLCLAECDPRAVVYDDGGRNIKLKVGAVVLAPGQEEFDAGKIGELGYRRFANVITNVELERMLSPTGPYGGLVLRPSDGEVPSRIAFIQCVGSRNEAIGADYCSNICCMSAMKEAVSLSEQIEGAGVKILHRDIRPFGKGSEEFYLSVKSRENIGLVPAMVTKVEEVSGNKNLVVEFSSNGEKQKEEFELVVLSVGVRPSASARGLSRTARVKLNKYGFCLTDQLNSVLTGKDGVVVAGGFAGPGSISSAVCQAGAAAAVALRSLDGGAAPDDGDRGEAETASGGKSGSTGVFICKYGLSSSSGADAEKLLEELRKAPGVSFAVASEFLCVELSRAGFIKQISEENVSRAIVVPCYQSTYRPLFEKALREAGVVERVEVMDLLSVDSPSTLPEPGKRPDTSQVKEWVLELIKKAEGSRPTPSEEGLDVEQSSSALVIGAGLAGLTAAMELSRLGHEVTLLEKHRQPGGNLLRFPLPVEAEGEKDALSSLREEVEATINMKLLTSTELVGLSGESGRFSAELRSDAGQKKERFGAVVVCTGGSEHVPDGLLHGRDKRVATQSEFQKALAGGEFDGSSVVMIQCVGSRNEEWPVCSRVCCAQALRNALKVTELKPEARVTILHRDIRVYSLEEELLSEAMEKGVEFVRMKEDSSGGSPRITLETKEGGQVSVNFTERASGAEKTVSADTVVLSTGMRPQPDSAELAGVLSIDVDEKGHFREAHPELRPVETSRKGIYFCGLAHSPQTASETVAQALAAAKKASSFLKRSV